MVNELYALSRALEKAGIQVGEEHRQIKELRKVTAKAPCLRIWFSRDGRVSGVSEIAAENAVNLRKWEPNNGSSFPAFNMSPLYGTDNAGQWDKNALAKIEKCLHTVPAQLKQYADACGADRGNAVYALLEILPKVSVPDFRRGLEAYVKAHAASDKYLEFLVSSKTEVQVFLDLQDRQPFDYFVADVKSIAWINSVLLTTGAAGARERRMEREEARDAFGDVFTPIDEPMPSVKLPYKVGDVKLRAMFHDHQCQSRYRMIDDASYPISGENRAKLASALKWLKDPDREGATWGMMSQEEILFAYPETLPKTPPRYARLLGAAAVEAAPEKFVSVAADVVKTLRGLPPEQRRETVRVFAIRKMDKARSKVVFHRNYTTERIIEAAEDWQKGCANIPGISFRVWPEIKQTTGKQAPETIPCEAPLPALAARVVNAVWKLDGTSAGEVKRMKYYQGIELLLDNQRTGMEAEVLAVLLANSLPLVLFLGNTLHGKDAAGRPGVVPARLRREHFVCLFPLLGLLLYKQNRVKEDYMEDIPYLLGQMLKISDELHTLYCQIVRKGEVPPQLAGNSLFVTALETPERALAQLGQRVNPYVAWAKQYRTRNVTTPGEESWRASWYLNLYARNATALGNALQGEGKRRFNDLEKARLFIGYFADFPKKGDEQQTMPEDQPATGGQS